MHAFLKSLALFCSFLVFSLLTSTATAQEPTCMVSSAHPIATDAGLTILRKGGNAFDAAVAIASTLGVVEPMMSGMGGYGTIVVYDAQKKEVRFLDSSGKIPMHLNSDVFRRPTPNFDKNRLGPKSISTPGNVNAWEAMSSQYGNLEWKTLFEPAINTADNGFTVSKYMAYVLERTFESMPTHAQSFYGKNGKPLSVGETLVQKDLARSMRLVADKGSRVFYDGTLAQAIHTEMKEQGSFLSIDDLRADKAEWWKPIQIDYRGFQVFTASPPANSFPALIRLGMMKQFGPSKIGNKALQHNSADFLHLFAEVTKHAYECRLKFAGDPEITPPPLEKLLADSYFESAAARIDFRRAKDFVPPAIKTPNSKNTTHFVVADKWGNIVSATQTLGNVFGSRIMAKGTGIWFNNSLAYCTFEPKGNPMDAKPGQRKLSGDCPTIIFKNSQPWAAVGTPGGHTIAQTVPQIIMNLIDFDMEIDAAITARRVSFVEPNSLAVERGIDPNVVKELRRRGHNVRSVQSLGNAHGLRVYFDSTTNKWHYRGAADPRGRGTAKGF